MIKKIFLIVLLFSLAPLLVFAQNGLVPCGPGTAKPNCELCDIFVLMNNVLDLVILRIVPVLAILMLIIGGLWYYFAGISEDAKRKAKSIITSSVIGIVIIIAAWVIVNTIFQSIGIIEMEGWQQWYNIQCPT